MNRNEPRLQKLIADVHATRKLVETLRFDDAKVRYASLSKRAEALGIHSAYLLWSQAEVAKELGELEVAFEFIQQAVLVEPLGTSVHKTFVEVCDALREKLTDAERDPTDPSIPRIYDRLSRAGETEIGCHLSMARYFLATGRAPAALKLLNSVTLLASASLDAWKLKAEVARNLGDEPLVASCEEAIAQRMADPIPFGVPTRN